MSHEHEQHPQLPEPEIVSYKFPIIGVILAKAHEGLKKPTPDPQDSSDTSDNS
jgi:hypothetical protein